MKTLKRYLRIVALLPAATVIYLRKQGVIGWAVMIGVPLICLAVIVGVTHSHHIDKTGSALGMAQTELLQTEEAYAVSNRNTTAAPTPVPTPAPSPVSVTLTFAGDCTMGMDLSLGYAGSFNEMYDQQGPEYFLSHVKSLFAEDDLTIVNFEGTLTDSEDRADKSFTFKGEKDYATALTAGSVEAVDLANNHTHDYGKQGFADTEAALDDAGIVHFGYKNVTVVEANGVKVGFTGLFTVYEDPQHLSDLQDNIRRLREQGAELIVACFHWGWENDDHAESDQRELAHAAIDAGAHLVIGHHPHVLQGVEVYRGRYIVYSLGNFCFGGNYAPKDYDCMIFRQTFTVQGDQVLTEDQTEIIPCSASSTNRYNDYRPTIAEGAERERILEKLWRLSQGLGEENVIDSYLKAG